MKIFGMLVLIIPTTCFAGRFVEECYDCDGYQQWQSTFISKDAVVLFIFTIACYLYFIHSFFKYTENKKNGANKERLKAALNPMIFLSSLLGYWFIGVGLAVPFFAAFKLFHGDLSFLYHFLPISLLFGFAQYYFDLFDKKD